MIQGRTELFIFNFEFHYINVFIVKVHSHRTFSSKNKPKSMALPLTLYKKYVDILFQHVFLF